MSYEFNSSSNVNMIIVAKPHDYDALCFNVGIGIVTYPFLMCNEFMFIIKYSKISIVNIHGYP